MKKEVLDNSTRGKNLISICLIGHFDITHQANDGQKIKTRTVYDTLVKEYGVSAIKRIDTYGWKKHPIKLYLDCKTAARKSTDVIIMPAQRGIKVFVPLLTGLKKKYSFKLHYIVVGGWLYDFIKNRKRLIKQIRTIDHVYIENKKVKKQLNDLDINNVELMLNFKNLKKAKNDKIAFRCGNNVLKCCIFSRIEKLKGIDDAVTVVKRFNNTYGNTIILDIYGKIDKKFRNSFIKSIKNDENIRYNGVVNANKSVDVIKKYDLLIFPTKYKTEGIPGTIIDAFFAGTPVLASRWDNFEEILTNGENSFFYSFNNLENFFESLEYIYNNRKNLYQMRANCLRESKKYKPKKAMEPLFNNLERKECH